jgi:anti-sigma factor RsiW
MNCEAVNDLIEELASGAVIADPAVAAHLDGCARCRGRLARARAIDAALAARKAPEPAARFVADVMARIRRDRWRAEQLLDTGFNAAVVAGVLFIVAGVAGLVWTSGILAVGSDLVQLAVTGTGILAERFAREMQSVALAVVFFTLAAAVWWWTERDAAF